MEDTPNPYMGGAYGPFGLNMALPLYQNSFSNTKFPFLATLELPNLSRLTNDPIQHNPTWQDIPVNILIDIPKFDGKIGEDLTTHITTYYLLSVSNSLLDSIIHLCLFPHTLTSNALKWFIEFPTSLFNNFNSLALALLIHFQLPIHYEIGIEILTSL